MNLQSRNLILQDLNGFLGMNEYDEIAEYRDWIINKSAINSKQQAFFNSNKKELLLSGSVGSGKTTPLCLKAYYWALKYPGNRVFICRQESTTLPVSTLQTLFDQVIPARWIVKHNTQKKKIELKTPDPDHNSFIHYGGLDKKAHQDYSTKIGSTEFGTIAFDETSEGDKGTYEMLAARLRYKIPHFTDKQNKEMVRQMMGATNPESPSHWLYKRFFVDSNDNRKVWLSNLYENSTLTKDYIKLQEESFTGVQRERLLFGKWTQAEGVIFKEFDMSKHVVEPKGLLINNLGKLEIAGYKNIVFGADSNYPLPRAGLLAGVRGDGTIDIIDEFYKKNSHVERLGEWISEWSKLKQSTISGYHDPSDPDAIERLNKFQGVMCEKAKNAVIPGISEVARYFAQNKIRISNRCPELIRSLQSYKWKKNAEGEVPDKDGDSDHMCFIAGTKILTLNGEKNIEDIIPGEYVLTRRGWKEVEISEMTNLKSEVFELLFNDGRKLICTGNHPIWVKGKGWKRADTLRYSYIVVDALRYLWQTKTLMEGVIIKEKMDIGEEEEDSITCTEMCGNITMDQFLKDMKYIIKMKTKIIMTYLISNVLHTKNIKKDIQLKIKKKTSNIFRRLDLLQKNGIEAWKEESGIPYIGKIPLENPLGKENIHVFVVVTNLLQELHKELNTAIQTVSNKPYVIGVRKLKKKQKVYNLKIKNCHEYFANGILVSNCDALRYLLFSLKITTKRKIGRAIY